MAPRSPTQAFEPTPALERNRYNYSPFNRASEMISFDSFPSNHHRGVRFSEPSGGNFHRAHSIATENVPLLPAVASASTIPRTAFRITNPTPGVDITAYIENCRNLNEQLRQAHEAERRAWNIERTALKSRIADLEFALNKSNGAKRRLSNDSHAPGSQHSMHSDVRAIYQSQKSAVTKPVTDSIVPTLAPVWKGPESTPPVSRVFQTEETNGHHLPSISENDLFPTLSKEVSPTAKENAPIPIEKVDSTLDGITLRSAALTSSFEAKITSPQFASPSHSPGPKPTTDKLITERLNDGKLHIDASTLLSPLDEKLKRHAGHTPMAFDRDDVSVGTSAHTTELTTPIAEKPPAPAPTTRPPLRPAEQSDSYFSTVSDDDVQKTIKEEVEGTAVTDGEAEAQFEPEDDVPLRGPLMLDSSARTKAASAFLEKLDAKLEAVRETSPDRRQSFVSVASTTTEEPAQTTKASENVEDKKPEPDDDMPKLKLRKSTNFGSAYGFNMPGFK